MINLFIPKREDLWFRQMFMSDEATMSYNHHWGGTIPFPEEDWKDWYDYWIVNHEEKRFYRYLQDEASGEYVGEIAYNYDERRKYIVRMSLFILNIEVKDMENRDCLCCVKQQGQTV